MEELPPHITKTSMPKYWEKNGKRELRIVVRKDCYRINEIFVPS